MAGAGSAVNAGMLADPTGGVRLAIPRGWSLSDDVGAASCEAPSARADITGRVSAAQIRIEAAHRSALVPRATSWGRYPDLATTARDVVRDAFDGDATAVLVDARPWSLRTGLGDQVEGIRIDHAHHDMTTAMVSTTILVDVGGDDSNGNGDVSGGGTASGRGMVRVTASVPVAHHGAVAETVERALASIVVDSPQGMPAADLSAFDPGSWEARGYRPAPVTIDSAAFEVFLRGSHKISPRWRAPVLEAGLIDTHGVATPVGHYVRRAVSRPDRRVVLQVWDGSEPSRTQFCVDVLDGRAVLRSSLPAHVQDGWSEQTGGAGGPGGPDAVVGLEVRDMAAVPARLAAWLGLGMAGPGRSFVLAPGRALSAQVIQSMAPGTPAVRQGAVLNPADESPAQLWARLVAMLA